MADYSQKVTSSFNERVRLIRLRRKKENLRFWDEFRIIPKWLVIFVGFLYVTAMVIAISVNHWNLRHNEATIAPDLMDYPVLEGLVMAAAVTTVSLFMAILIFLTAYINRDAYRRGMNAALWTLLTLILIPETLIMGHVIYFLMREPLPYPCPQCSASVSARFNFCPNCKCNLQPSCPNCKREVAELDKFCPYCGTDLNVAPSPQASVQGSA